MAPSIRIDDEVYSSLKARAEAFVDTPNSVLRRLLGLKDSEETRAAARTAGATRSTRSAKRGRRSRRKVHSRAPKGSVLSEEAYVMPILSAVAKRGGSAPVSEVIEAVGEKLDGRLGAVDRETLTSGQVRWMNRTQFVRLRLVNEGLLADDSPRGIWAITERGRSKLNGSAA